MRLDKYLANAGCETRSRIKKMIRAGFVSLNTKTIKDPGYILSNEDIHMVYLNGQKIDAKTFQYYILHKPDKYITALKDSRFRVISELIPEKLLSQGIFPVGRLDYHTTGLLLLTTNGQLAHRLLSPNRHIPKTYIVDYIGTPLTKREVVLFSDGLELKESGRPNTMLKPADLEVISDFKARLTITEGKTHQVRRMFAAIERPVRMLHRISFGNLTLGNLPEADFRELNAQEVEKLLEITNSAQQSAAH